MRMFRSLSEKLQRNFSFVFVSIIFSGLVNASEINLTDLKQAAERGDVNAQFQVGLYYYKQQDREEAKKWFLKAAKQGSAKSAFYVGLTSGTSGSEWFEKARSILDSKAKRLYRKPRSSPPSPFIDKGACPFEGCAYSQWLVRRDTLLYRHPNSAKVVGRVRKGQKVKAIMGEVHTTVPGIWVVAEEPYDKSFKVGDVIYTLTNLGEGSVKAWRNGELITISEEEICRDEPRRFVPCLGSVRKRKSTWWIEIELPNDRSGWTKEAANFCGSDALGIDLAECERNL